MSAAPNMIPLKIIRLNGLRRGVAARNKEYYTLDGKLTVEQLEYSGFVHIKNLGWVHRQAQLSGVVHQLTERHASFSGPRGRPRPRLPPSVTFTTSVQRLPEDGRIPSWETSLSARRPPGPHAASFEACLPRLYGNNLQSHQNDCVDEAPSAIVWKRSSCTEHTGGLEDSGGLDRFQCRIVGASASYRHHDPEK